MKNIDALLDEYVDIKEALSELSAKEKTHRGRIREIERELISHAESTQLTKLGGARATCTIDPDAIRFGYEPDQWSEIFKWAADTGNDHIIQRRLNDASLIELMDGDVPLPPGLKQDTYTKISIRRSA